MVPNSNISSAEWYGGRGIGHSKRWLKSHQFHHSSISSSSSLVRKNKKTVGISYLIISIHWNFIFENIKGIQDDTFTFLVASEDRVQHIAIFFFDK